MERWPPIPFSRWLALTTMTAAFHRMNRRIRRSMSSSPGNSGCSSSGIVLTYGVVTAAGHAQIGLVGPLQQLGEEVAGPDRALLGGDTVEGVHPLLGFGRVGVGELIDVLVADRVSEV